MKNILILLLILTCLQSCASSPQTPSMAVGIINAEQLLNNYVSFSVPFQQYQLTAEQSKLVQNWPNTVTIDTYFGTWCHDSQREVPKLLKALQVNEQIKHRLIALDGHKTDPLGLAQHEHIQFTPTFVVFINNKELGRVVERPKVNLIADIDRIIKNNTSL